jgi:hypothetical protein
MQANSSISRTVANLLGKDLDPNYPKASRSDLHCRREVATMSHKLQFTNRQRRREVDFYHQLLTGYRPQNLIFGLECIELLDRVATGGSFNFAADCQQGLAMQQWLQKREFAEVLRHCSEQCIEVFWAPPASGANATKLGRAA